MKYKIFNTILLSLSLSLSASAQISNGRIGHWPFNGSADDMSGNNHHPTIGNGITLTADLAGDPNSAYFFPGTSGMYIENSEGLNFGASDFSISVWCKTGASFAGSIASKQNSSGRRGWNLWFEFGQVRFIGGESPNYNIIESRAIYNDNNWHHIVAVRSGNLVSDWRLYIDGEQTGTIVDNSMQQTDLSSASLMYIGKRESGDNFIGSIDELAIYNRVVTVQEVSTLYGITLPANGRIGYWPFNGNTLDESAQNHHAQSTGASLTTDRFGNNNAAYAFDANDRMSIRQDAEFNFGSRNFSISMWFKASVIDQQGCLLSKQLGIEHLGWNVWFANGKVSFNAGDLPSSNTLESTTTINDGQWHHVVAIRVGASVSDWKLFVDGQENSTIVSNTFNGLDYSSSAPMYIGGRGDGYTFSGSLDDITIFNRVVTSEEIQHLYQDDITSGQFCESVFCDGDGNVGIGTQLMAEGYRLSVKGKIMAEGVKVELQSEWPDYVFQPDYKLPSLKEVDSFVKENHHLPGIPSASDVKRNGIDLEEINIKLLRKIEELTLYQIELLRKLEAQETRLKSLEKKQSKK